MARTIFGTRAVVSSALHYMFSWRGQVKFHLYLRMIFTVDY